VPAVSREANRASRPAAEVAVSGGGVDGPDIELTNTSE
jgi:hypothetical protein